MPTVIFHLTDTGPEIRSPMGLSSVGPTCPHHFPNVNSTKGGEQP